MSVASEVLAQHASGFKELNALWEVLDSHDAELTALQASSHDFLADQIERTIEKIRAFEPSVSVLGQVKAGKSTLLNALIGQTDLLPSDVNPWTSVITGVHLNSRQRPHDTRALFRFFDALEWDRLVETGGRLGEMANRAGFAREAGEIRAQVEEMRQNTEDRFGSEFRKLLGSSHAYPEFDKPLIDRYICYGDPDDLGMGAEDGVFADLTKTADLYLDLPGLPRGLCLRDTPGVNDTFMMREQITLNAVSESRVCVIVLSAHQALSTTDLALLRIICSVEAREVILFVNRIDELRDTQGECARIRASIERTLTRAGLDSGIEILFGSGHWANLALSGKVDAMSATARATLDGWWQAMAEDQPRPASLAAQALQASGVGALHLAITRRITEGPGAAILRDIRAEIGQIREMNQTVVDVADRRRGDAARSGPDGAAMQARLQEGSARILARFAEDQAKSRDHLATRLEKARSGFIEAAVEALQNHINTFGENSAWECEPTSLRMAMRTAYLSTGVMLRRQADDCIENLLDEAQVVLEEGLGIYDYAERLDFPELPDQPSPTILARTLSLDLNAAWWRRFWRFGAKTAAESRYRHLIDAETAPLIEEVLTSCFDPYAERVRATLDQFGHDQASFVRAVADAAGNPAPRLIQHGQTQHGQTQLGQTDPQRSVA